jgi:hypothetical protein
MSLLASCALRGLMPAIGAFQPAAYALQRVADAARSYSAASGSLTDGKPKTVLAVLYSVGHPKPVPLARRRNLMGPSQARACTCACVVLAGTGTCVHPHHMRSKQRASSNAPCPRRPETRAAGSPSCWAALRTSLA